MDPFKSRLRQLQEAWINEMPSIDNDLLKYVDQNPINRSGEFRYERREFLVGEVEIGLKKMRTSDTYKVDFLNGGRVFGFAYVDILSGREGSKGVKYATVSNIKISKEWQGKGIGYAFYKWLISSLGGINGLVSDIKLTKEGEGRRGSYWLWVKLSKEYPVYSVEDRSGEYRWNPLEDLESVLGHGRIRYGIRTV